MTPSRREVLKRLAAVAALPSLSFQPADDPLDGSIATYQAGRRDGRWTAEAVTRAALERCRTDGMRWRAIDALIPDSAISEARASDTRLRAGGLQGPLDGVPLFAKSIYDVRGLPTTASNEDWARLFPEPVMRDALEVARLRAAGAVILGKTAADDFAYRGSGTSSHTGQVLNPHDLSGQFTPGGSSAGSAVAVAGGLAFAALGTDDGGSNRIPAQFTGVVGVKPTFGLVPRTGVIPTWPYLDTHGPLARTVADAALMLTAIAGGDVSDPLSIPGPSGLRDDSLAGIRLGLVEAHVPRTQMSADAIALWDRAFADVRAAGAIVEPFAPSATLATFRDAFATTTRAFGCGAPDPRSPAATANALLHYFAGRTSNPRAAIRRGYEAYRAFYDVLPATYEACEPLLDQPLETDAAGRCFARARAEVVAGLAASLRAAGITAMIYPTMPFAPFRLADGWPDVRTPLGYGNWLGLPEVSVPAGFGADGLPGLNLSIVGLPGDDALVLELASRYERQSARFRAPRRA